MTPWRVALVLALLAPAGAATQADDSCAGRVFVNSVYAAEGGGGRLFVYFVQVQNRTLQERRVTLSFAGFPGGAVESPRLAAGPLRPYEQVSVRFGQGDRSDLRIEDVAVAYDGEAARHGRPSVTLSGCRAGP